MQFNDDVPADLARYGITADDVAAAGCQSFDLVRAVADAHIRNDKGDLWTPAQYHSRTPQYNTVYRADLIRDQMGPIWLEVCFVTLDVTKEGRYGLRSDHAGDSPGSGPTSPWRPQRPPRPSSHTSPPRLVH